MSGPLNLADADLKGFDAVDAGRYAAEVFEIKMDAVKNTSGTGAMPAGTPMLKVQFRLTAPEEVVNRRVFSSFVIPPKGYDAKKAATMKGMLAKFFIATGDAEETVVNSKFDPDFEDYIGRPVAITVGKEAKKDRDGNIIEGEYNNPVKGIKNIDTLGEATASGLL